MEREKCHAGHKLKNKMKAGPFYRQDDEEVAEGQVDQQNIGGRQQFSGAANQTNDGKT